MIDSDKQEFADAVREVLKSYRQECGSFTLKIWWAALVNNDLKTVLNAMAAYCAHPDKCKFAPKAGDIVGMIEGTSADRKELAILAFSKAIQNVSSYDTVVFDDPAIHHAIIVGFGSWQEFGMYQESKFECQEQRRTFLAAYASFKKDTPYLPKLIGILERDNSAEGYPDAIPMPKYIGDHKKALAVESGGRIAISGSVGAISSNVVKELKTR